MLFLYPKYVSNKTNQDIRSKKSYALTPEERKNVLENTPKPERFTRQQAKDVEKTNLKGAVGVANSGESGIIETGRISGALNPDSKESQEHANRYYESVRHMTTDVNRVAQNTEFSENDIAQIKDFIFMQKHDLGGNEPEYFYPSYEMSQSWQRLIDGKNIQKHDITLIRHEIMERNLMEQGYSQSEAHKIAEKQYNYSKECKEYYAEISKHSKK